MWRCRQKRTVFSKQVIQQLSDVFLAGPVAFAPHASKQRDFSPTANSHDQKVLFTDVSSKPRASPALSTAAFMESSLQAFETRLMTAATFQLLPYPSLVVEYLSGQMV
eukprot:SAG31_NODE_1599_length_7797_cov_10.971291_8_plen_108_part_00